MSAWMDEQAARDGICAVGKLLYDRGYVVVNDGNISVRVGENELIVTPSGVSKGRMTPEMMVKTDMEGNVLAGDRYPSSEVKMHLMVFKNRPDVGAVIHSHAPKATAFAVCHKPIAGRYLPEMLLGIGEVPVAEFAMPSTDAVPRSVEPYVKGYSAVLLANHGVLVWGGGLWEAFDRMEVVEYAANMLMDVQALGGGVEISQQDADTLLSFRGNYEKLSGKREE